MSHTRCKLGGYNEKALGVICNRNLQSTNQAQMGVLLYYYTTNYTI